MSRSASDWNRKTPQKTAHFARKSTSEAGARAQYHRPEESPEKLRHVVEHVQVLHASKPSSQNTILSTTETDMSDSVVHMPKEFNRNQKETRHHDMNFQHLRPEKLHFKEYIQHNVNFPNRVALQLQRILGTTRIHLNDHDFVGKLQEKIELQDNEVLQKSHRRRALSEYNRIRRLLINEAKSDYSMSEQEQMFLKSDPVYRANQMLRRIDAFNKTGMVLKKVMTKIEPVEPYEHNGDKFFQHLHATGEKNWVPKSVRPCKKKSKNAQNVVRTLYKRSPTLETDSSNDTTTENDTHSPQTNTAVTENSKQSDKYSAPNEKEIKEFLQEQIKIDAQEKDQERKLECRAEAVEESPPEDEVYEDSEHPDKHPSPIQVIDPSSFERLQKSCDIDEVIDIIQHQKREDLTIIKYIDQAEDANELFGNANALNRLYDRETVFAEKFISALHKKLTHV